VIAPAVSPSSDSLSIRSAALRDASVPCYSTSSPADIQAHRRVATRRPEQCPWEEAADNVVSGDPMRAAAAVDDRLSYA
jgi:hypothetical protein